jgi:hypothetical protein
MKLLFKKPFKNKRGVVALYIVFIISAITIVLIASVFAPMGVLFNTKMYAAGLQIMETANTSISNISDPVIKAEIQATIQSAYDAADNNIDVNAALFQYGWILVIGLVAVIVFMYTRSLIEVGGGGFV